MVDLGPQQVLGVMDMILGPWRSPVSEYTGKRPLTTRTHWTAEKTGNVYPGRARLKGK
jgi:hypothetical protein